MWFAIEDNDPVACRAAGELHGRAIIALLSGRFARALDEDLNVTADERLVLLFTDRVLDRQEFLVPSALDRVWDVVLV